MKAQLLEKNLLPQRTERKRKISEGLWNKIEEGDFYNHEECFLCCRPIRIKDAQGNYVKHHSVRAYHGAGTIMSVESADMIGSGAYESVEAEIVDKMGNVISETTIDEGGEGGNWAVGSCCAKKLGKKWVRYTDWSDWSEKTTEEPVEEPAVEVAEEVVADPK